MEIINVTCPRCSREYYGDVLLLSLDVELHCPFCGAYFRKEEVRETVSAGQKMSDFVRLSRNKNFYRPKEKRKNDP